MSHTKNTNHLSQEIVLYKFNPYIIFFLSLSIDFQNGCRRLLGFAAATVLLLLLLFACMCVCVCYFCHFGIKLLLLCVYSCVCVCETANDILDARACVWVCITKRNMVPSTHDCIEMELNMSVCVCASEKRAHTIRYTCVSVWRMDLSEKEKDSAQIHTLRFAFSFVSSDKTVCYSVWHILCALQMYECVHLVCACVWNQKEKKRELLAVSCACMKYVLYPNLQRQREKKPIWTAQPHSLAS